MHRRVPATHCPATTGGFKRNATTAELRAASFSHFAISHLQTKTSIEQANLSMPVSFKSLVLTAVTVVASLSSSVEAHGFIQYPAATYKDYSIATNWNARFTASQTRAAFQGKKWDDSPANNIATFTKAFNASGFASLKKMVDDFVPGCHNTRTDVAAKSVKGGSTMVWRNDQEKVGFIESHRGPCEIWIGDRRVFQNNDCRAAFPQYPASLPVNYSFCKEATCVMTFYWLAVHEPQWQIYKQCVPITLS